MVRGRGTAPGPRLTARPGPRRGQPPHRHTHQELDQSAGRKGPASASSHRSLPEERERLHLPEDSWGQRGLAAACQEKFAASPCYSLSDHRERDRVANGQVRTVAQVTLWLTSQRASPRRAKHGPVTTQPPPYLAHPLCRRAAGEDPGVRPGQSRSRAPGPHCPSSAWLGRPPSPSHRTADRQTSAVPWCRSVPAALSAPVPRQGCKARLRRQSSWSLKPERPRCSPEGLGLPRPGGLPGAGPLQRHGPATARTKGSCSPRARLLLT